MLQFLREKITGWVAITILVLLSIPFAFFGMEQYLFQRNAQWVAQVQAPPTWWRSAPSFWPVSVFWQREEVSVEEFNNAFNDARMRAREQQGEMFDARQFESAENKRAVLEQLVDARLLAMGAAREGMSLSNAQLRQVIAQEPSFQIDGRFDAERYRMALLAGNPPRTPAQFDAYLRERLQAAVLPNGLIQSAFVTDTELNHLVRLTRETRDVSAFILPAGSDTAPVDDAQAQAWYSRNQAQFRVPENVTLDYIEFTTNDAPAPVAPSEAALRTLYEQQKSRYGAAAERLVSHILVEVSANASAADQASAETRAKQLAERARAAGADFAAIAREASDDAGSRNAGGDLGWISQDGTLGKAFEDAAFGAEAGSTIGPVRSDFGWHIIQVRQAKAGDLRSFAEVRPELEQQLAETEHERAYNEALGKLAEEVYKNPTTLEPAARSANLQVKQLGPINREPSADAPDLAQHPVLLREAFSEALIQDGTVSDPIEITPGRNVLIRVNTHNPASTRPLDQVREEVTLAVQAERARKAVLDDADALIAQMRDGKTLQAAASERNLQVSQAPGIMRMLPMPTPEATRSMFSVLPPQPGKPAVGRTALPDGSVMVFSVDKVTPGETTGASEAERQAVRQELAQVSAAGELEALRKALRQRYRVTIEESRL